MCKIFFYSRRLNSFSDIEFFEAYDKNDNIYAGIKLTDSDICLDNDYFIFSLSDFSIF